MKRSEELLLKGLREVAIDNLEEMISDTMEDDIVDTYKEWLKKSKEIETMEDMENHFLKTMGWDEEMYHSYIKDILSSFIDSLQQMYVYKE
jgi:hypothetical protein